MAIGRIVAAFGRPAAPKNGNIPASKMRIDATPFSRGEGSGGFATYFGPP